MAEGVGLREIINTPAISVVSKYPIRDMNAMTEVGGYAKNQMFTFRGSSCMIALPLPPGSDAAVVPNASSITD